VKAVKKLLGEESPTGRMDAATRAHLTRSVQHFGADKKPRNDKELVAAFNDIVLHSSEGQRMALARLEARNHASGEAVTASATPPREPSDGRRTQR
jgi:hypothetical protein